MPQMMLSHSRDNRQFVDKLAIALRKRGLDIWYDCDLHPGDDFRKEIRQQIITSPSVLVVWSKSACHSKWVPAEADLADSHNKLLQVISEPCDLPLPFGNKNYTDLTGWNGYPSADEINKIIAAAGHLIERASSGKSNPDVAAHVADDLAETRAVLADVARLEVSEFIAKGEVSNVYLGRYGTRFVSVKAIDATELTPAHRDELSKEIELAAYLQDSTFLRIPQIIHRKHRCFIVTDFCNGETVARKMSQGTTFSIDDVVMVVSQLAEAIAEAHTRGLRHLRIIPDEIFVYMESTLNRKIARISPINFAYFRDRLRMENTVAWQDQSGPFMAPELWRDPSWFNECMRSSLEGEELVRAMYQKANQFALGMVAWTMLEGQIPIAIPEQLFALTKIQRFLDASEKFSERVLEAGWRADARALARIIARMVAANPAKRWEDMKQVSALIGALAADHAANQLEDVVKAAYQRICREQWEFYSRFYDNLFHRAPHLRVKFPSDMTRQHRMLDFALGQLLNYRQQQSEPTTLTAFVDAHSRLGLTTEDFKHFGEALIDTFDAELTGDLERQRTMAALEIVIWPGIYYLMQKCAPTEAEPVSACQSAAAYL